MNDLQSEVGEHDQDIDLEHFTEEDQRNLAAGYGSDDEQHPNGVWRPEGGYNQLELLGIPIDFELHGLPGEEEAMMAELDNHPRAYKPRFQGSSLKAAGSTVTITRTATLMTPNHDLICKTFTFYIGAHTAAMHMGRQTSLAAYHNRLSHSSQSRCHHGKPHLCAGLLFKPHPVSTWRKLELQWHTP